MNQDQQTRLSELVNQPVHWQCPLDRFTSFSIGGPAEAVVQVESPEELQELLTFLKEERVAWRVIGRGTNLLVKDEGFAGIILVLAGSFKGVQKQVIKNIEDGKDDTVRVRVGAGYSLVKLAVNCMEWGLTGLEFACGIPGTLGGAVMMNAGAWGGEMSSIVHSVTLMTAEGEKRCIGDELDFSYRCWNGFLNYLGQAVVTEVELKLTAGNPADIKQYCRELQEARKKIQSCAFPNAGSFFKNPANDSAGRLIDSCGLKGATIGGAMVSEHHGNFLVNKGGATAADVLELMKMVQAKVQDDRGVLLEPEVHLI